MWSFQLDGVLHQNRIEMESLLRHKLSQFSCLASQDASFNPRCYTLSLNSFSIIYGRATEHNSSCSLSEEKEKHFMYPTHPIINRGLYIFYPIFQYGL